MKLNLAMRSLQKDSQKMTVVKGPRQPVKREHPVRQLVILDCQMNNQEDWQDVPKKDGHNRREAELRRLEARRRATASRTFLLCSYRSHSRTTARHFVPSWFPQSLRLMPS